jgi:hypothetical protein
VGLKWAGSKVFAGTSVFETRQYLTVCVSVTVSVIYEIAGELLDWLGSRTAGEGLSLPGIETTPREELDPLGTEIAG